MIQVIISGIVTGSLYAIIGLGLVAVYRVSKVLNFALGATGAVAAYIAYEMFKDGVPYIVVLLVAVLTGAVFGFIVDLIVARPLRRSTPITIGLATLGVLLVTQGVLTMIFGNDIRSLPSALSHVGRAHFGSVSVSADSFLIVGVALVACAGLSLMLRYTRLGLAVRAVSSGPQTASLLGVNVGRTHRIAWMIGGGYGALASLLVIPMSYLSPLSPTTFLLSAFAAIVLGGFTSLGGVVVGAMIYGITLNLAQAYVSASLSATYTFAITAVVLVLRPNGIFGTREHEIPEPRLPGQVRRSTPLAGSLPFRVYLSSKRLPLRLRLAGFVGLIVILGVLPFVLAEASVYLVAVALASFVAVSGLNVVTGYSGQVSIGHAGFLAVGAYSAAISIHRWHVPSILALVIAAAVSGVAGLIVGVPATRLRGIYLAVLTLTFAAAIPELIQRFASWTNGASGLPLPMPGWVDGQNSQYWFVLAVAVLVAIGVSVIGASRIGRKWRAVRDSEPGARSSGINATLTKLGAFSLGAAIAGLAGGLSGMVVGFVDPTTYDVFLSVYVLLALVVGGSGSIFGSFLGALFITLVPHYTANTSFSPDIVFGAVLVVVMIAAPGGLASVLEAIPRLRLKLAAPVAAPAGGPRPAAGEAGGDSPSPAPALNGAVPSRHRPTVLGSGRRTERAADQERGTELLSLDGVSAGYGNGTIVKDVTMSVATGEIVALLGANGAGKSTILRTISRMIIPTGGCVRWRGEDLGHQASTPSRVVRAGVSHVPEGRAIFPDLTVSENLSVGRFGRSHSESSAETLESVLTYFPRLRERLKQRAGTLSGGEQQMLAIGRAMLARPSLLMLDEPSLGLAPIMSDQVFEIVQNIAASGVSVLLVEQNAKAALALADRGYMIQSGRVLFTGQAKELAEDPRVTSAYLGGQHV